MDKEMRTKQMEEAKRRLSVLTSMGLHPNVEAEFAGEGKVNVSTRMRLDVFDKAAVIGALYWADEDQRATIESFEKEHGAVVYHATAESTDFGRLLDLFYVSPHEEEWELDMEDLKSRTPLVYTENLDDELYSEYGGIGIRVRGGGLIRTA